MNKRVRFTRRELDAISEALAFRMAGEIEEDAPPYSDYQAAEEKVGELLARMPKQEESTP